MATSVPWNCPFCTYLNKANISECRVCLSERPVMNNIAVEWSCPICTFKNQGSVLKCEMCQQGTIPVVTKSNKKTKTPKEEPIDQNSIITVGDQVTLCNCEWHGIFGIIYCILKLDEDEKYGVRLLQKRGFNTGWYKSVEYFKCDPGFGAFVTKEQIQSIDEVKININRITLGTKVYVKRPSKCIGSIVYIGHLLKLAANSSKTPVFGRKNRNKYTQKAQLEYKKELDEMYYGVCLDKPGSKAKVFVKRNDLEYPISKQHQIINVNENKMAQQNKENIYQIASVYNCFKITNVGENNNSKIIKIFVTENSSHCIVVNEVIERYKENNHKSSFFPPMLKYKKDVKTFKYTPTPLFIQTICVNVYKLNEKDNEFKLMVSENSNMSCMVYGKCFQTDVVYDNNCRLLLNVHQSKMHCADIEIHDDICKLVTRDVSNYFDFGEEIIFVSFLNEGNVILSIFKNGCVITMDSKSFQILNTFDVSTFYPELGDIKTEQIGYTSQIRKQNLKILTVALNENKNCIAWIESEYNLMYYLQIYSLKLITTSHKCDDIDYKQYLITSRLIAQKTAQDSLYTSYKSYDHWQREEFRSLTKRRYTQWDVYSGAVKERVIKKGNTQYLVGTMAAINDKTVKLMFNDGADKLLYCSIDNMSNDLLVIDRNTMSTLNVTCKGTPSGWIFKDYLIVSQIGLRKQKKFTTLDIQGFISETSVAEVLCYHALKHINFPWVLCLEIAVFTGSSREFRDITLVNYTMDCNVVNYNNILLENKPCYMVWNVGNYVVIQLKYSNEIIFYDSRYIKFKDEDTMIAYTEGHGIIARNNKKNLRTFRKLWIDQSWKK